jgi:hypothetical protein
MVFLEKLGFFPHKERTGPTANTHTRAKTRKDLRPNVYYPKMRVSQSRTLYKLMGNEIGKKLIRPVPTPQPPVLDQFDPSDSISGLSFIIRVDLGVAPTGSQI